MLLNSDQIAQIDRQLDERGRALTTLTTKLEDQIADRQKALDAKLRERVSASGSTEERQAVRQIMGKDTSRELNALRRELVAQSEKDRQGILAKVEEWSAAIDQTEALFTNPVQVLSRHGLGKPERTELQNQLAGAGPAELRSAADLAIATGDRNLAAAVLVVADRGGQKYRQFDRAAFAEKVVGPEVEAVRQQLAQLRTKVEAMRSTNRAFERGASSPQDKIRLGLAQHQLQQTDPDAIARARRSS